jgi:hypothetical protein
MPNWSASWTASAAVSASQGSIAAAHDATVTAEARPGGGLRIAVQSPGERRRGARRWRVPHHLARAWGERSPDDERHNLWSYGDRDRALATGAELA